MKIKPIKNILSILSVFTLILVNVNYAHALSASDLEAIRLGAPVFYGNGESGSSRCVVDSGSYPILKPTIIDDQGLADAIDEYIQDRQPDSPFTGMGVYFVEGGKRTDINPIFAVATAINESSLGTDQNTTALDANNAFGRTATQSQPSVTPVNRTWYAWSSWEASLYSPNFPASGNEGDEDDWFQFMERRYDGNFSNGLEAFYEGANDVDGYAPSSDGNDVDQLIENTNAITNDIVEIAGDAIDIDSRSFDRDGCVPLNVEGVVETALTYAWHEYRDPPYTNARDEYDQAISRAVANGEYVGGRTDCGYYPGIDCGGFTTRVIRDSGFDENYNSGEGPTTVQRAYMQEEWEEISVSSTSDLEPGDIAYRPGHVFLWVGEQPGFETQVASASISRQIGGCRGWRAPMAGRENPMDGRLEWYRNVN